MSIKLGATYRNTINGFTGVATGVATYLEGSERVELTPMYLKDDGTEYEPVWVSQNLVEELAMKEGQPLSFGGASGKLSTAEALDKLFNPGNLNSPPCDSCNSREGCSGGSEPSIERIFSDGNTLTVVVSLPSDAKDGKKVKGVAEILRESLENSGFKL